MKSVEWYQLEMELLVNVKPLRWQFIGAYEGGFDSQSGPWQYMRGTLSEWEVCKAMSIIWIIVANVYRIQRRMMEHKGGYVNYPKAQRFLDEFCKGKVLKEVRLVNELLEYKQSWL